MSKDVLIEKAPLSDEQQQEQETLDAVREGFEGVIDFHQVRAEDVITLTARLAQVLAEEADHLERMQISKIAALQKEKVMLSNALAILKKQLPKGQSLIDQISADEAERMRDVITVFNEILEENYTRLNMARLVNQRVVEAITDAVKQQTQQDAYDGKGQTSSGQGGSVPVSINEKI